MPPQYERYQPERLPSAAQRTIEGSLIETAESVARRSHESVRTDQAREFATEERFAARRAGYFAVNRIVRPVEEADLLEWAQAQNLMLDEGTFRRKWEDQGRKGETEHLIYFEAANERWFKLNNLSNHGNWLEYFHRLALHNWLFQDAPLRFEGLMVFDNELLPMVSQPHILAIRGAFMSEIDTFMQGLDFKPLRHQNPARQFDYINHTVGVEVNDLHDENVVLAEDGEITVIDPVPMMEQESKMRRLRTSGG